MEPITEISPMAINGKTYNGNTRKFGITIDHVDYIVKFPKDDDMSVYCEYIASNFLRNLGVPCHEVSLGTYHGILVDIIKDFTSNTNLSLHSYKDTKQSSEDTELGDKEYIYDDVPCKLAKHISYDENHL